MPVKIQKDIYDFIDNQVKKTYNTNAIIFAELLFGKEEQRERILDEMLEKECFVSHITNSLYAINFYHYSRNVFSTVGGYSWKGNRTTSLHGGDTPHILGKLNQVTRDGGNLGFAGSHDQLPLYTQALRNIAEKRTKEKRPSLNSKNKNFKKLRIANLRKLDRDNDKNEILKAIKEQLASIVFTSTGGYLLQCGDEYGHDQKKWVFDCFQETEKVWINDESNFNIFSFIKEVNQQHNNLPEPSPGDWFEHVVLENYPDLLIILIHSKINGNDELHIILVNISTENIAFGNAEIDQIAKMATKIEEKKGNSYCHDFYNQVTECFKKNFFCKIGKISINFDFTEIPAFQLT